MCDDPFCVTPRGSSWYIGKHFNILLYRGGDGRLSGLQGMSTGDQRASREAQCESTPLKIKSYLPKIGVPKGMGHGKHVPH